MTETDVLQIIGELLAMYAAGFAAGLLILTFKRIGDSL